MSTDVTARTYEDADPRWSCNRKKPYYDQKIAKQVARGVRERSGENVVAYACTHCGAYHIGRATV